MSLYPPLGPDFDFEVYDSSLSGPDSSHRVPDSGPTGPDSGLWGPGSALILTSEALVEALKAPNLAFETHVWVSKARVMA